MCERNFRAKRSSDFPESSTSNSQTVKMSQHVMVICRFRPRGKEYANMASLCRDASKAKEAALRYSLYMNTQAASQSWYVTRKV